MAAEQPVEDLHINGSAIIGNTGVSLSSLVSWLQNIETKANWWKTPVYSDCLFYGVREFHKNEWIELCRRYSIVQDINYPKLKPGCTRWFNLRILANDNASNHVGVNIYFNYTNGTQIFWQFDHTWGTGSSDWANWKCAKTFRTYDQLNKGWAYIQQILPNSSNGSVGYTQQLWLDAYDVPNGIDPNTAW